MYSVKFDTLMDCSNGIFARDNRTPTLFRRNASYSMVAPRIRLLVREDLDSIHCAATSSATMDGNLVEISAHPADRWIQAYATKY